MVKATGNKLTLQKFKDDSTEVINRIHRSGKPEYLTVNGKSRAVLMAPSAFEQLRKDAYQTELARSIQKSWDEYEAGKASPAEEVMDRIRGRLLSMKKAKGGAGKR
jgi:PHD/YefM family antitoxin component YafN of YafNO toxin-antitoxin module